MANILYNSDKLLKYGFECIGGEYVYTTNIYDNQFVLTVTIDESGLTTTLLEKDIGEVYTLHLVSSASGKFVNRVREEFNKVLNDINERCSDNPTKNELVAKIQDYVEQKFGDSPEYLWEKYPDASIIRRKDTQKWYALFMNVAPKKLGLSGEIKLPIIDLRFDPKELPSKVDNQHYFPGYHMNKKHWITIILDGSVTIEEIFDLIDKSYNLAKK